MIQERKYEQRTYRIDNVSIGATIKEEKIMDKLNQPDYLKAFEGYNRIDCPGDCGCKYSCDNP